MAVLGIDLGGTKLAGAVFSEDGSMISEKTVLVAGRHGPAVGELITGHIEGFLAEQQEIADEVMSVGVCVPGISYQKAGTVWAPNIPGWENYPLLDEIRAVTGSVPVSIESDRACYILGEFWQGAVQGCKDAIFLAVGTGIGAGILIDGKVLHGAHDSAGSTGWMALERPFESNFTECGNFETYASGEGIPKYFRELVRESVGYDGPLKDMAPDEIVALNVFQAYDQNDPIAKQVIERCIELWGMAAANLVSLFDPEKLIFGGGVFGPAIRFLPEIYAEARKWAQPVAIKQVRFEPSSLGNHAGIFGAGLLALRNLKEN